MPSLEAKQLKQLIEFLPKTGMPKTLGDKLVSAFERGVHEESATMQKLLDDYRGVVGGKATNFDKNLKQRIIRRIELIQEHELAQWWQRLACAARLDAMSAVDFQVCIRSSDDEEARSAAVKLFCEWKAAKKLEDATAEAKRKQEAEERKASTRAKGGFVASPIENCKVLVNINGTNRIGWATARFNPNGGNETIWEARYINDKGQLKSLPCLSIRELCGRNRCSVDDELDKPPTTSVKPVVVGLADGGADAVAAVTESDTDDEDDAKTRRARAMARAVARHKSKKLMSKECGRPGWWMKRGRPSPAGFRVFLGDMAANL